MDDFKKDFMQLLAGLIKRGFALAACVFLMNSAYAQSTGAAMESTTRTSLLDLAWGDERLDAVSLREGEASPACPNGLCPGLGNAFFLPTQNAQSINTGGKVIFMKRRLGECADVHGDIDYAEKGFKSSDSMQSLTRQMMRESTLDGSVTTAALSMKGSIMAMSGEESTTTTTFQSTHMDIQDVSHAINFRDDESCLTENNIEPDVLKRFMALPLIDAGNVSKAASWAPYVNLLKQTGSHIMLQQLIGSRFQQWESNTSTAKDAEKTLQIKACATVEGVKKSDGWSVNSCAAYSQAEKEKSLAVKADSQRIILGSSNEARNALMDKTSKENLDLFLRDSDQGNEAIRFGYKPIFLIFHAVYQHQCSVDGPGSDACNNVQRAITLEAAYDGWLAVGCPESLTTDGFVMQAMEMTEPNAHGVHTYQCRAAALGCKAHSDCHVGANTAVTYCYGKTCIDKGDMIPPGDMFRDKVRTQKSGSYDSGVNKSCYYKATGKARCHADWASPRLIYSQGQ